MSDLPRGWHITSLGKIGLIQSGVGFPNEAQGLTSGDYPVYKVGDVSRGVLQAKGNLKSANNYVSKETAASLKGYIFPSGSTLFAKIGEALKLNRRAFVLREGLADNNVMGYKAESGVSDRFIYHYLRTQDLAAFSRSTTVPSIRKGDVEELVVLLPPADEQTRIAAKLDELLAQVDILKARIDGIPALLKRFRQSVLAAAVSGRLTESREESDLPSGWQLVDFSSVIIDLRYGTAQKCDYNGGSIGVLRIPNIGENCINLNDLKFSDFSLNEINKLSLKKGDVLLIRSNGSVELVGKSAMVGPREEGLLFAGYLIRVRLNTEKVIPEYVNYWLKSPAVRQVIEMTARSTSGVNNINSEEIKSLIFTMPPLPEQSEIVRRVEQLFTFADQLEARVKAAQARIDRLTQSILAKAFCGELVPQDPNDEPASVLLERIKTQRAAAPKAKRGRRSAIAD
ncbi:restriction endonuclease subunit S [Pseudomonas glycinae]|uniref:restriction endonuclease subunit S n=1 Tax=Pseudomonas glycinae TaxID=1785145 RepID=UPI001C8A3266|nr:restriction endonuclease subunit S [Pseudomonas glycinae]MBX8622021.1 restriction endonuclease subunit S [Pseudomonas glycinae]